MEKLIKERSQVSKGPELSVDVNCSIKTELETNIVHIGQLPSEVLNYIIKWVVSSDLDLKSLENCSEVCRGFYFASRYDEIWRLISVRMWGSAVVSPASGSWRELFLTRPRIRFSGCYVSRSKYQELQRFLRLFPGGQVIMAMSSDDDIMAMAK